MNFAAALRCELTDRAQRFAQSKTLKHYLSYGEVPAVCFVPDAGCSCHGNFIKESYNAISSHPAWLRRLAKVHAQGRSLPPSDAGRWMELDSCMSSDALLMNIFCYPGLSRGKLFSLLNIDARSRSPCFGYRARVPLLAGRFDRTEVDMQLGNLLVEAKLTESDFQRADKQVLANYRDFHEVFDAEQLPQTEHHYHSYQLLRNVLAAYSLQCSFCVLLDGRRPDLSEAWYEIVRCVKPVELRTELRVLTWQELAQVLPSKLQVFLQEKYGINANSQRRGRIEDRK